MSDKKIVIKNVRLSYFYAFHGKVSDRPKPNGEAQMVYSTNVLIPKTHPQVPDIIAAINAAKEAKKEMLGKGAVKSPLLDGDAKEDGDYKYMGEENRGHYILRASNYTRRPKLVDQQKQEITNPDLLYSGCYANVLIDFYAYSAEGGKNKGISPGLEAIQKKRDGERLDGGGVDIDEVFDLEDDEDDLLG
jgi:hypothetical protein